MKILWICGLPRQVQDDALDGADYGANAAWSWIMGHLPPPDGIDLHIACPCVKIRKPLSFDYFGVSFHLIPCVPGRLQTGYLFDPLCFRKIVKELDPAIVHGWGTESSFSIIAQSLLPERSVVQVQGLINAYLDFLPGRIGPRYMAFRERSTLRKAKTVFVESQFSAEIARPFCGKDTNIVHVDHPLRSAFIESTSVSGKDESILFVGALCERKGYLDAVKAFINVAQDSWKLTLIGGGVDAETGQLAEVIASTPYSHSIEHIPLASSDQIVEIMQRSSIFLLPSSLDTGPTALKEALALGLWPVCYDNSGPQEYITRFSYGSLAKTASVNDLTDKLASAMNDKPWQISGRLDDVVTKVRHELCSQTIWKHLLRYYGEIAADA